MHADYGLAAYDVRNIGVISAVYMLPFGRGKMFGNDLHGFSNFAASGWSVDSIVTLQSGFSITPQLSYNPSTTETPAIPSAPSSTPTSTARQSSAKPSQWFNPSAFLAPPANSGFYGNLGRDTLSGPGLATWDFAGAKDTTLREGLTLQFRGELFNILNRANFNTPNLIVFTPSGVSGTAGAITSTSTTSRQVQFALKLLW